jgi:TRAP transporter TAXI family solute receptor
VKRRGRRLLGWAGAGLLALLLVAIGDPREFARAHGAKQRLSIATAGTGGVYYVYGGGVAKVISEHVRNVEATAEVTGASVENLNLLRDGKVDIAFSTGDALADAYRGTGSFARTGRAPARTLAVLYTNYTHLVTLEGEGIERVADLRGRVVSTGPAGSGSETAALRILAAAGLSGTVRRQALSVAASVDAIKDGKIDAFFYGCGVPCGSVLDLASTPGMRVRLIPTAELLPALERVAGPSIYLPAVIPAGAYPGVEEAVSVAATATVLVVDEAMSEELAYEITRVLFERRDELVAIHPEAKNLTLPSAVAGSPVPFHAGAVRYYRERGAWRP